MSKESSNEKARSRKKRQKRRTSVLVYCPPPLPWPVQRSKSLPPTKSSSLVTPSKSRDGEAFFTPDTSRKKSQKNTPSLKSNDPNGRRSEQRSQCPEDEPPIPGLVHQKAIQPESATPKYRCPKHGDGAPNEFRKNPSSGKNRHDEAPPNADALHEASGSGPKTKQNLTNAEEPKKNKKNEKEASRKKFPAENTEEAPRSRPNKEKAQPKKKQKPSKRPIKPTQHFFPPPSDDLQENDSPVEGDSSSPSQDPYLSYIFATPQTIKSPATRRNVGPVPVSASHLHSVSMSSTSTTSTTSTTKTAASFRPSPHQPSKETTEHETTKAEDKDKFYTPMSTMNKKNPRTPSTRTSVESTPRNKPLNFSSDESFGTPNYSKIDKSSGSSNNGVSSGTEGPFTSTPATDAKSRKSRPNRDLASQTESSAPSESALSNESTNGPPSQTEEPGSTLFMDNRRGRSSRDPTSQTGSSVDTAHSNESLNGSQTQSEDAESTYLSLSSTPTGTNASNRSNPYSHASSYSTVSPSDPNQTTGSSVGARETPSDASSFVSTCSNPSESTVGSAAESKDGNSSKSKKSNGPPTKTNPTYTTTTEVSTSIQDKATNKVKKRISIHATVDGVPVRNDVNMTIHSTDEDVKVKVVELWVDEKKIFSRDRE